MSEVRVPNFTDKDLLNAIEILFGEKRDCHVWMETIEDPDTKETIQFERCEVLRTEPILKLEPETRQKIVVAYLRFVADNMNEMSDDDLEEAGKFFWLTNDLVDPSTDFDTANRYISIFESLANRKGEEWQNKLRDIFYYGKPEIGIFRNNEKAREYDLEVEPYEHDDDDVCSYTLRIRGTQGQLETIQKLIDDLCQKFGTPDNEFGLYVPVPVLMKILVGSDEYLGNILSSDIEDNTLNMELECESDVAETLKYALQCSFGNLEIEVAES